MYQVDAPVTKQSYVHISMAYDDTVLLCFITAQNACNQHKNNATLQFLPLSGINPHPYIDGLVQERRNSSAYALELCLSCTNP